MTTVSKMALRKCRGLGRVVSLSSFLVSLFILSQSASALEQATQELWVEKPDGSVAQYPGGERALSIDEAELNAHGIVVRASKKGLGLPGFSLPFPLEDCLTSTAAPKNVLPSGVNNLFLIAKTALTDAESLGFLPAKPTTLPEVECGRTKTLIAFGQSNSANSGHVADLTIDQRILMFYNGSCYPARDPLLGATIFSGGGSVWMKVAKRYIQEHPTEKIAIVSFGVGGSVASDWKPSGMWFPRTQLVFNQLRASTLEPMQVYWHQGESDNGVGTSREKYLADMEAILTQLRLQFPKVPVAIAVASYLSLLPYDVSQEIQTAQLQLIEKHAPLVSLSANTDF
jgi:hypothetical protein